MGVGPPSCAVMTDPADSIPEKTCCWATQPVTPADSVWNGPTPYVTRLFDKGSDKVVPDCAYNHKNYTSGLRYRERPLASAYDNVASKFSLGLLRVDSNNTSWLLSAHYGNLNRKG